MKFYFIKWISEKFRAKSFYENNFHRNHFTVVLWSKLSQTAEVGWCKIGQKEGGESRGRLEKNGTKQGAESLNSGLSNNSLNSRSFIPDIWGKLHPKFEAIEINN